MLVLREISKFDLRLARYTREQSPAVKFIINKYSNHVEYRPFFVEFGAPCVGAIQL